MGKRISVQKITLVGVFAALSLGIYAVEAQFPVSSIGGIKLGLANVVTLCAMIFIGRASACCVLGIRILLASAFYGTFVSFMFSLCGGALACAVMCLLVNRFDRKQIWVVSVFGALGHNAGQLCVAVVLSGTGAVVSLAPYLAISAVGTGLLTGVVVQRLWFSPLRKFAVKK
ncbi:MAG: Gx transporter family protein [Ruminococcus sp.]|nr:Gx transporter family protein [Ruminococcus sp.]